MPVFERLVENQRDLSCSCNFHDHLLCPALPHPLHIGLRVQHLRGSGVPRQPCSGDESRPRGVRGGQAAGSAGNRSIYSTQAVSGLCVPACQIQKPGTGTWRIQKSVVTIKMFVLDIMFSLTLFI